MRLPPSKKLLFGATIPVLWIAILAAIEGALVAFGYGEDRSLFRIVEPGMVVDNPAYIRSFYPVRDAPEQGPQSNLFVLEKAPSKRRVFVVGGSTAQGFPFQRNHSFTAIAQASLRSLGLNVDVVNVGNSAMSSYYVRSVLEDITAFEPDLAVVYAGHNEYYGTVTRFTGGTHATRLLLLWLKRFRTVQLMEDAIRAIGGESAGEESTLMERRFATATFPPDSTRDAEVAELFIRNLSAGVKELAERGIPVVVFEPIGNLVSMPPFRSAPEADDGEDAIGAYLSAQRELEAGTWDRRRWEAVRDLDAVPFRARSTIVSRLEGYAAGSPLLTWVPTADEFERRGGYRAFTDSLFIDHLHFNFEGQVLLGRLLAEAIIDRLYLGNAELRTGLDVYFADPERIREDIHLTDFWLFEAYLRILNLLAREPFASMKVPKSTPTYPASVTADPLFRTPDFATSLEGVPAEDYFYLALQEYQRLGHRDEYVRNLNAYVHLFPGDYETQLNYGMALLADDPRGLLDPAGEYFRRAYHLSGKSEEVVEAVRAEMFNLGLAAVWERYRRQYLE